MTRERNVFKLARGPNADAARAALANLQPTSWDGLADAVMQLPGIGPVLRAHALKCGLLVFDADSNAWHGCDAADTQGDHGQVMQ